ncbi:MULTISPECIES: hypothetical protein [Acinetobacter]|jgi:hypothetical protein|uniref:hypothetical protein n=1 Tax=Acinetobacter TaxID=469 RepID=UPI0002CFF322|nr:MULTISPECIES: hypothetical protein [Acinetobacter]EJB8497684.1 hypothetical protein [Acinetobacter baumannii]EJB8578393.1 hypothetical protein [Acinetobacter baumannii]ENX50680.1 hypothetical protein F943_00048 [Acinetobacter ursingii NIPH 706]MCW1881253.1 hypothetical protein [Acinetobacter baumannii]MDP6003107.1 hypothetical protein [Acinetobacter bereziniae]
MINFNDLSESELLRIAQTGISNRIGLRTSGQLPEDDRQALSMELQGLYEQDREQLILSIKKHSEAYKSEQSNQE